MRLPIVALCLVAACGTEEGSLLTIRTPDGPDHVARLEIVLANSDESTITRVDHQRVAVNDAISEEAVRYYRQRATAGSVEGVGQVNGFTVRLEPNVAMVPDETFIPFLVAYDAQDNVVGVGAVLDEAGQPTTIVIEESLTRQYFVDMVALRPMDPKLGMGDRQSMHVVCGDAKPWTSGVAWRPGATQLRLLLADRSDDPLATDASEREADLDCDGFVAPSQDCDDLRTAFNVGRTDVCDGVDSNCDGAQSIVQACGAASCSSGGVQLCDDRTGQATSACTITPACACDVGTGCNRCMLSYKGTSNPGRTAPCAPSVGKMKFPACIQGSPCTIEVVPSNSPWRGYVSTMPTGGFMTKISNVTSGDAYIEAKLSGGDVMANRGDSIGEIYLLITQDGQSRVTGVDLQLVGDAPVTACPANGTTGTFVMTCQP